MVKAGIPEDERANVVKVRTAEQHVPTGLSVEAYKLKKEGGSWVKDEELIAPRGIVNTVTTDLSTYKTKKGNKSEVLGLKTSKVEDLSKASGVKVIYLSVIQNAANLFSEPIRNIGSVKNKLTEADGYNPRLHKLYVAGINKISGISRDIIKLN